MAQTVQPAGVPKCSENVRALIRGLAILRFVNAAGDPRPSEIAAGLSLPRPTVYRLAADAGGGRLHRPLAHQ